MPVLTPQGTIGEAPVVTSSPKTITPMTGDAVAPTIAVNNQGRPGYDIYGNKVAGTPLPGGGASTPTTISTSDAEKKINEIKNKVDNYNGVASTSTPTEDPAASLLKSELASAKSDAEKRANDSIAAVNSLIDPYLSSLSLSKQRQIEAVKQSFAAAQKLLEESNARVEQTVNTAGIRSGTARYSPETQAGIMASEYRASAMRVADLSARENAAIAEIETAMDAKTFSVALSKYQELSKIQETKNKAVDDLQTKIQQQLKDAQELKRATDKDFYDRVTKPINDIALDVAKNNAPVAIQQAVLKSKTVQEAIAASGDYLQTATGDLGEALAIKRDLISRGLPVPKLEDLLIRVANQKAKAQQILGTLTPAQSALVNTVTNSYENSIVVKNFVEVQNRYNSALANVGQGDGASDISYIYDLMKILDPTSVVRNEEYETGASKSGNIFAGKAAYLNGLIDPKGGFLSEGAKENIMSEIQNRYDVYKEQYNNLRSEKVKTLEKRGIQDASELLTQYDYAKNPVIKKIENAKQQVDTFITNYPKSAGVVSKLYEVGNVTDDDILEYIKLHPELKQ